MSIRWVSTAVFTIIFLTAMGLGALAWLSSQAAHDQHEASAQRYASYLLSDELRSSSDDLTRLARTYVVTGDDTYEEQYWETLAVRNGESPREDGRRVALAQLMLEAGFSDAELGLLAESQANSDALVTTETVAMNAVKGLYDNGEGDYVVRRAPDPQTAVQIMHAPTYHMEKRRILDPINRFSQRLDARTSTRVALTRRYTEKLNLILQILIGLLIATAPLGAWITHRYIVRPVVVLQEQIDRISRGDNRVDPRQVIDSRGDGEMARLARSVETMNLYAQQMAQTARSLADGDLTIRVEPRSDVDDLSAGFQHLATTLRKDFSKFRSESGTLNQAASQLATVAGEVTDGVAQVSERATAVAAGAEQTSESMIVVQQSAQDSAERIGSVATSTEEMTATISEIAASAESTRQVTRDAVDTVENASGRVAELGNAADRVGEVLGVIVDIAEQTKLLALNATIEAASAGDAGKGFAVGANEVKELARQTAEATAQIRRSIQDIQASSTSTVDDIGQIRHVIARVDENVSSIATAVEEQAVTTRDIAINVNQAAQSMEHVSTRVSEVTAATSGIAGDIGAVDSAAKQLHTSMDQVDHQARALATLGVQLRQIVQRYHVDGDPSSRASRE
ncbi:MAG: HAMP domain-containing protein [Gemmatimonadetes bacterium]|nr:HAMP domain-containing protein [Gemmatimonadota bacterium]